MVFYHSQPFYLLGREAVAVARVLAEQPRIEIPFNGVVEGHQILVNPAGVSHQRNQGG